METFVCKKKIVIYCGYESNGITQYMFYDGNSAEFNIQLLDKYLKKKISGYKQQDTDKGREISKDNYINTKWLKSCMDTGCISCGCNFDFEVNKFIRTCNLTEKERVILEHMI